MGWPEREAVIPTLALGGKNQVGKIRGVTCSAIAAN